MRGRSQKKTTIQEVQVVIRSRNHQLLDYELGRVDPNTIPQQSYLCLRCLTCNNEWKTKLQVYLSRTSPHGGCRQCYNNNVQNKELYPNSPCLLKPDIEGRPKRRAGREVQRQAHLNGQYGLIQNRQHLIDYLTVDSPMDETTQKTKRELANLNKRTKETIRAIEKGMVWTHKDGYEEVIPPNEVSTVEEIQARLVNALPTNHSDRSRMELSKSSKTYIRDHINTVFSVPNSVTLSKPRNSAYGFVVRSLT